MIYSGHKIRLYRAILFGLIILLSAPPLSAAELPTVRLWPTAERTRLVIETTLPLEYKVGGLTNPARLVLDVAIAANVGKKLKKTDISVRRIWRIFVLLAANPVNFALFLNCVMNRHIN